MENRKNKSKAKKPEAYIYNPEGINPYDYESGLLKTIRSKWKRTSQNKQTARDLVTDVERFRQSFSQIFKLAPKHFESAVADFNDAVKALEKFIESKLKQKDDHYFVEGINKLKQGLNLIIAQLEQAKDATLPSKKKNI